MTENLEHTWEVCPHEEAEGEREGEQEDRGEGPYLGAPVGADKKAEQGAWDQLGGNNANPSGSLLCGVAIPTRNSNPCFPVTPPSG